MFISEQVSNKIQNPDNCEGGFLACKKNTEIFEFNNELLDLLSGESENSDEKIKIKSLPFELSALMFSKTSLLNNEINNETKNPDIEIEKLSDLCNPGKIRIAENGHNQIQLISETDKNVPGQLIKETDKNVPGQLIKEADRNIPGQLIKETDRNIPGQLIKETDRNNPGQLVKETDKNIHVQLINETDRNNPGQLIKETDKDIPGQLIKEAIELITGQDEKENIKKVDGNIKKSGTKDTNLKLENAKADNLVIHDKKSEFNDAKLKFAEIRMEEANNEKYLENKGAIESEKTEHAISPHLIQEKNTEAKRTESSVNEYDKSDSRDIGKLKLNIINESEISYEIPKSENKFNIIKFNLNSVETSDNNVFEESLIHSIKETYENDEIKEITIKLKPDEYGSMTIKLNKNNDFVSAKITTNNPVMESLLTGYSSKIIEKLSLNGIEIHELDVSLTGNGNHFGNSFNSNNNNRSNNSYEEKQDFAEKRKDNLFLTSKFKNSENIRNGLNILA